MHVPVWGVPMGMPLPVRVASTKVVVLAEARPEVADRTVLMFDASRVSTTRSASCDLIRVFNGHCTGSAVDVMLISIDFLLDDFGDGFEYSELRSQLSKNT